MNPSVADAVKELLFNRNSGRKVSLKTTDSTTMKIALVSNWILVLLVSILMKRITDNSECIIKISFQVCSVIGMASAFRIGKRK